MTVTHATSVGGFTIFPLRYSSSATHNLYIRAHSGTRPKGVPEGRSLFVVNAPPDATEHELAALFGSYGTVEKVVFASSGNNTGDVEDDEDEQDEPAEDSSSDDDQPQHPRKKRKLDNGKEKDKTTPAGPPKVEPLLASSLRRLRASGSSAHVVFLDPSSLQRSLSSSSKPVQWPPKTTHEPHGLAYYAARHAALRPPLSTVLTHAESVVLAYDYKLEKEKRREKSKYKKGEEIVDEDGFTLVVRGGVYGQSVGGGVGVASKRFELGQEPSQQEGSGRRNKRKKDRKEKDGFYAFQVREKNLKEHAELRRKFEEDKQKVDALRKKRAFVPY